MPQPVEHGGRQAQQTELVCDGRLAFSEPVRRLLLGQVILLHQPRDAGRLLDEVQIPSLEIFDQRQQPRLLRIDADHKARRLAQPREPCRAQAALARDQLHAVRRSAHGQRLEDAVLRDAGGKLLKPRRVKDPPRLRRVRMDLAQRQEHDPPRLDHGSAFHLRHGGPPNAFVVLL